MAREGARNWAPSEPSWLELQREGVREGINWQIERDFEVVEIADGLEWVGKTTLKESVK